MTGYSFHRDPPAAPVPPRQRDYIRVQPDRRTIASIQSVVAAHFGTNVREMTSDRRARMVARPRQIAMYLCSRETPRSLPEIGRSFGHRDHTTVMHAIRRIEQLRAEQPDLDAAIKQIEAKL